jgi:hypothetical protein
VSVGVRADLSRGPALSRLKAQGGWVSERIFMNYSLTHRPADALAESANDVGGNAEKLRELCELGFRTLRSHNLRKQAAKGRGERSFAPVGDVGELRHGIANDAAVASATHQAISDWQQANMSAAAAETLLSRVLGGYRAGSCPSAIPCLIAEVIETRARANDLLYDVLLVAR